MTPLEAAQIHIPRLIYCDINMGTIKLSRLGTARPWAGKQLRITWIDKAYEGSTVSIHDAPMLALIMLRPLPRYPKTPQMRGAIRRD